ncbi:MAG: hypothetical protein QM831_38285 [Kofleriaceae bacterium]
MNLAAVMAAIRADPADDEPRLVWSDAIGGERGELVAIQCLLARGGHTPERARGLRERESELIRLHGREWSELAGFAQRCTFRRGFVDSIVMRAGEWSVADVFGRAPLATTIVIERATAESVEAFLRDPDWQALPAIGFNVQRDEWITLRLFDRLAREDLSHLRGFEVLTGALDPVALPFLPECVHLRLWLPQTGLDGMLAPWLRRMKKLRALHVQQLGRRDIDLPAHLVELGASWVDEADMPVTLQRLKQLVRLRAFGRFSIANLERMCPHLQALDVARAKVHTDPNGLAFAKTRVPGLRELAWQNGGKGTIALAHAFGAQLELFDPGISEYPIELREMIAGQLVAEADHFTWAASGFLTPRCELAEPWLGQIAVSM